MRTISREELVERCGDENLLFMDGFDDCLLGLAHTFNGHPVVAYDGNRIVRSLMAQGMTEDEAEEFYSFNIEGCYLGEYTPIIIR